jgi:formylglycine-generating enzyme required for sulfatase activity
MILRKGLTTFIILMIVCSLSGCSKKKAEEASDAAVSQETAVEGEMVLIPAGEAIIGTDNKDSLAYPQHKVNLPAFWIDKYEVTNHQFLVFSAKEGYTGEGSQEGKDWRLFATVDKMQYPVVYITWNDANAYCKSAGKRLPTEEEWEKAARGSNGFSYPWGNEWTENHGNTFEFGLSKPGDVGQYQDVSPYGVQDMLGNVQEWTASWYKTYPGNPKKDANSGETYRVVRGLSSRYRGKVAHLWDRTGWTPKALFDFGCRCAKDATPEEAAKALQAK